MQFYWRERTHWLCDTTHTTGPGRFLLIAPQAAKLNNMAGDFVYQKNQCAYRITGGTGVVVFYKWEESLILLTCTLPPDTIRQNLHKVLLRNELN